MIAMVSSRERILVVENDPEVSHLIARQTLQVEGFLVKTVADANFAIPEIARFAPDLIIANLDLPGLSGKDLMAAITSQNLSIPVIMVSPEGKESDIIQSFRLGAADYLKMPIREAEVVQVVERALRQVRARKEREQLAGQLETINQELEKRVNELTTIFGVGKAVTSITNQTELFQKIVAAAVDITGSHIGWLLMKDDITKRFVLRSYKNLPNTFTSYINKPWDDGISSFVARSNETLSLHGSALNRFKVAALGKAAMTAPVKVKQSAIALIAVVRTEDKEYTPSDQAMLEAICDYASISLVNNQLFHALDDRAMKLQTVLVRAQDRERAKDDILEKVGNALITPINEARARVDNFILGRMGRLKADQKISLEVVQQKLARIRELADAMATMNANSQPREIEPLILNDLINRSVGRYTQISYESSIEIATDLPSVPIIADGDRHQISSVLDQILSNAIKFSPKGGVVRVWLGRDKEGQPMISIQDEGIGISEEDLNHIFERFYTVEDSFEQDQGGLGVGLSIVNEIVNAHGGSVWAESELEQGTTIHFSLLGPRDDSLPK